MRRLASARLCLEGGYGSTSRLRVDPGCLERYVVQEEVVRVRINILSFIAVHKLEAH